MSSKLSIVLGLCFLLEACSSTKKSAPENVAAGIIKQSPDPVNSITEATILTRKYSTLLKVPPETISNIRLYAFIDEWLKTPYKWGGNSKDGIDCSAFIRKLLKEVYNLDVPRTSIQQFYTDRVEVFQSAKHLSEGDILFFRTTDTKIVSHVGFYLVNNMFVNSSSSKGVSIASLNESYWKKRFVGAGRIKVWLARR